MKLAPTLLSLTLALFPSLTFGGFGMVCKTVGATQGLFVATSAAGPAGDGKISATSVDLYTLLFEQVFIAFDGYDLASANRKFQFHLMTSQDRRKLSIARKVNQRADGQRGIVLMAEASRPGEESSWTLAMDLPGDSALPSLRPNDAFQGSSGYSLPLASCKHLTASEAEKVAHELAGTAPGMGPALASIAAALPSSLPEGSTHKPGDRLVAALAKGIEESPYCRQDPQDPSSGKVPLLFLSSSRVAEYLASLEPKPVREPVSEDPLKDHADAILALAKDACGFKSGKGFEVLNKKLSEFSHPECLASQEFAKACGEFTVKEIADHTNDLDYCGTFPQDARCSSPGLKRFARSCGQQEKSDFNAVATCQYQKETETRPSPLKTFTASYGPGSNALDVNYQIDRESSIRFTIYGKTGGLFGDRVHATLRRVRGMHDHGRFTHLEVTCDPVGVRLIRE